MSTPRARALRERISIDPDEPDPTPVAAPPPESPTADEDIPPTPPPAPPKTPPRARTRRAAPEAPPEPLEGRKDYRSFYVPDEAYEPWRAAMYWLGRNPEVVAEHTDNMSGAVARWMVETAADLERRFNSGKPFPAPPKKPRAKRA